MRTLFFLLIMLVGLFCQAVFLPFNLAVLFLIMSLSLTGRDRWPVTAFAVGLLADLVFGHSLGETSLIFLAGAALCWVYSRKWRVVHPYFLFILALVMDYVSRFFWGEGFSWVWGGLLALTAGVWGGFLSRFQGVEAIRLKEVEGGGKISEV